MKAFTAITAFAAAAAANPLSVWATDAAPDPTKIRINSVGYAGTGCPQGSAYTSISGDAQTVTVLFDSYVATVGKGASPGAQRRACTLEIKLSYPTGYQFSVLTVRTQGYVNTDPGVTGQVTNSYFFSGVPGVASSTTNIPGNTHGNWEKSDKINSQTVVFSPCNGEGTVNMKTGIALQSRDPNASGYISADSIDASFEQKFRQDYGLDWIPCSGGASSPASAGPIPGPAPFPSSPAPIPVPVPVAAPNPYASNPYAPNPYAPNPYASNPFASNPFASNPFASNPYASNPFASPFGNPFAGAGTVYGANPYTTTTGGITAPITSEDANDK